MIVEQIKENSPYLAKVKDLGRKNRNTLGFFPEGAFEEYAAKGTILIAREKGEFLGYLLYRVVRRKGIWPVGVIVHLCVDDTFRNIGIARALVEKLCNITKDSFLRLELRCRRDFPANNFWPRVGFKYADEMRGRGRMPIQLWAMEFRKLPLVDLMEKRETEKKFRAVIDANVFYRLQDPVPETPSYDRLLSEEAWALKEYWLPEDVSLLITGETFNEIQRNDDTAERKRRLSFARQFGKLTHRMEDVDNLKQRLLGYFPPNPNESMQSDISQLSYAISGEAHFFITQDNKDLLNKAGVIYNEFGIKILSPGEFIGRLDEIIRDVEYRPRRLGGSYDLAISKVRSDQLSKLYSFFHWNCPEERKSQFQAILRNFIAQPNRYDVVLCHIDINPISLIVYERSNSSELVIPMIRVSRSPLTETVLRHLLRQTVLTSATEKRKFVQV
jgi:GNAT superfamily N-acetyltransferase/predicted nucleic acid-binding protein